MYITKEYLTQFQTRTNIPATEWSLKIIENQTCFVIKNPTYCNIFWVDFWYHYLSPLFKKQIHFDSIGPQDLTLRVSITESLQLIQIPTSMQNIYYYGNICETTPFKLPFTINIIFIVSVVFYIVIYFIGLVLAKKSPILLYV